MTKPETKPPFAASPTTGDFVTDTGHSGGAGSRAQVCHNGPVGDCPDWGRVARIADNYVEMSADQSQTFKALSVNIWSRWKLPNGMTEANDLQEIPAYSLN